MTEDRERFRQAIEEPNGELGMLFNELLNWARTSQDAEQFMSTLDIFNKHADGFMDKALKAYAEDVKSRLQSLREFSTVTIKGFSDHQIRIEVDAPTLRRYGLSASDIAGALQRQSIGRPTGELQGEQENILLRFDDQRKTAADFEDLVIISGSRGAAIRLGEIATISDRFELDEELG